MKTTIAILALAVGSVMPISAQRYGNATSGVSTEGQLNTELPSGQFNSELPSGRLNAKDEVVAAAADGQAAPATGNGQFGVNPQGGNAANQPFATPPAAPPGAQPPGGPVSQAPPQPYAVGTNQVAIGTNVYGVGTNQHVVTPTSRPEMTNGLLPQGGRDEASTPFDRTMVTQVRQRLQGPSVVRGVAANVSLISHAGQITATGTVPTPADKVQVITIIQTTPGVVGVVDQVSVEGQVVPVPAQQALPEGNTVPPP